MKRPVRVVVSILAMLLVCAASAEAADVTVVVGSGLDLRHLSRTGAVGLVVPGAGATVTRGGALSSLRRGQVTSSLLGGVTSGPPLIELARRPGRRVTIYVELPPRGRTHNVVRYPIAVVGGGYHGLLTSTSTRIPGLVSVADIAPTALALASGGRPLLRWRRHRAPVAALAALDARLVRSHDARDWAIVALVATAAVLLAASVALRSGRLARATMAAPPVAIAIAAVLSLAGVDRPWATIGTIAAATGPIALLATRHVASSRLFLVAFLTSYLVVLVVDPASAALAVIGPHPDGGGRYFGITNAVETMILVPVLALCGRAPLLPAGLVGALAIVTMGWSRAGADGGGLVVIGVGLAAVAVNRWRGGARVLPIAGATAAAGVLAFALVRLDRALGGSSHVTRASGSASGLGDTLHHRLAVSWHGATSAPHTIALCVAAIAAIAVLGRFSRRGPAVTGLVVALAVSLAVNDTPADVLVTGALGLGAMVAAERAFRTGSPPRADGRAVLPTLAWRRGRRSAGRARGEARRVG